MESNFLGKGWAFPPMFLGNGAEVAMVSGEEDIRQSLEILLSTSLKERLMRSDFGCDLSKFVFGEINKSLLNEIRNAVSNAILRQEGRVEVEAIDITDTGSDEGLLHISVDYKVRTTNNRYNLVFPFYINEANIQIS